LPVHFDPDRPRSAKPWKGCPRSEKRAAIVIKDSPETVQQALEAIPARRVAMG
jgi:hypothetical protein